MSLQDDIATLSRKIASIDEASWNAGSVASGYTWIQQDYLDQCSIAFQRQDGSLYQRILDMANNVANFLTSPEQSTYAGATFRQGEVTTQGADGDWLTGLGLNPFTTQEQDTRIRPAPLKPGEMSWKTIALIALGLYLVYKFA